ncbi:type II secretion system F family protein [Pseudonocardia alni]|uniref:type II secretion system F family protein n=1 Tax=Pseudonocardia alni TaxID=33907 RepID=UPI0033287251
MTPAEVAAALAGACLVLAIAVGTRRHDPATPVVAAPQPGWQTALRRAWAAIGAPGRSHADRRRRTACWLLAGVVVWALSGWPVAGVAVVVAGLWLPWLLGATRTVRERIEKLEALESWCRRMADTLTGGGAIGLAQAIAMFDGSSTTGRADTPIADAVHALARELRERTDDAARARALREFADAVDDRAGDAVAAALLLALHQQSSGVAQVLRQLADGVARDVRARRDIEAARAESRQSIRLLLTIQAGLLVLLALVPTFAAPYTSATGQVVMVVLLTGTAALLVWMRRLSLGEPAPRFFGSAVDAARTDRAGAA